MMRNTNKTILALMAGALAWSACNSADIFEAENVEVKGEMTITATGNGVDTRASVGEGNTVIWNKGDLISVFGKGKDNARFELTSGAGTTTGSFKGNVEASTEYFAIYPYNGDNYLIQVTGGQDELMVYWNGAEQTAGGNSLSNAPMVAHTADADKYSNSFSLAFQNAYALVKFTTDYRCKSITFKARGGEAIAAETLWITFDENNKPNIYEAGNTSSTVTLTGKDGEYIQAGTYYIAVLPGTLASGFDITFTNIYGEKTWTKSTTKKATFKRSTILNLGEISIKGEMIKMAGKGTSSDPYTIHDFDQLVGMREFVNTSTGGADCYKLVGDIDGDGQKFMPIGTGSKPFFGQFDGNGHSIKNIVYSGTVEYESVQYDASQTHYASALFGIVKNATIKNLTIIDPVFDEANRKLHLVMSPLVGLALGSKGNWCRISNCKVEGTSSYENKYTETVQGFFYGYIFGGFVANSQCNLEITECEFNLAFSAEVAWDSYARTNLGGFIGLAQGINEAVSSTLEDDGTVIINRCRTGAVKLNLTVSGKFSSAAYVSGFIAEAEEHETDDDVACQITNCVNDADLSFSGLLNCTRAFMGGFIGYNDSDGDDSDPEITNCINNGNFSANVCYYAKLGGIVCYSYDNDTKIEYCVNNGVLSTSGCANSQIGAITYIYGTLNECWNTIAGYPISYTDDATKTSCGNKEIKEIASYMNEKISGSASYSTWKLNTEGTKLDLDF